MSPLSLRTRLLVWLLLALAVLLVPLWVLTVREAQATARSALERALLARLGFLAATLNVSPQSLSQVTNDFGGVGFLLTPGGTPVWTDQADNRLPEGVYEALREGRTFRRLVEGRLWVAQPSEQGGFGVAVPLEEVAELPARFFRLYLSVGLVLLLLAWLVGAAGLSRSLRPVRSLARELSLRGPGFLEPLPTPPLPELRPAVESLNRLMEALSLAFERLREQEQAAKRFAYGASHELRNPLAALKGYLEVLQRRPGEPRALEGATREARRMEALLGGLLTLARLEGRGQAQAEPLDLAAFLRERYGMRVEGEATVTAEPALLELALDNLRHNAEKHGGLPLEARLEAEGGGVWLYLDDRGPGFPEALLPRVFEPFVKGDGSGTGLGLALVEAVARVHGGRVTARNRPEGGARVGIWFPA
ncbi:putative sensor histidine kinase TcrY [Calidithermus terrae]|uniref:histidine kinase n=1 Tax=Calidithermus terrae TaxID=1408545 RepID=A0A399DTH4_9DEIN|nr:HAMP domain-containing sensor histidine kinase [Calidithermus terrae]RIH75356.1 putative sensor histidine kinase TcrY [Calidithermus terrae]